MVQVLNDDAPIAPVPSGKAIGVGVLAVVGLAINLVSGLWIPAVACVLLLAAVVAFLWGRTLVGTAGPARTRVRRRGAVGAVVLALFAVASVVMHLHG